MSDSLGKNTHTHKHKQVRALTIFKQEQWLSKRSSILRYIKIVLFKIQLRFVSGLEV